MAKYATVPVINGLTDKTHPCQLMADVMTYEEHRGPIQGKAIAWSGDGNNMATSWIHAAVQFDFELRVACPPELKPPADVLAWAAKSKGRITIGHDPETIVRDADCVVTDTWVSMGDEDPQSPSAARRHNLLRGYQVDQRLMKQAKPDAIFMHCLPAHRGEEVTADVIDGPQSVVFDEAENRLHAQKSILAWCSRAREDGFVSDPSEVQRASDPKTTDWDRALPFQLDALGRARPPGAARTGARRHHRAPRLSAGRGAAARRGDDAVRGAGDVAEIRRHLHPADQRRRADPAAGHRPHHRRRAARLCPVRFLEARGGAGRPAREAPEGYVPRLFGHGPARLHRRPGPAHPALPGRGAARGRDPRRLRPHLFPPVRAAADRHQDRGPARRARAAPATGGRPR